MATGRDVVVLLHGRYHGHADELQGVRAADGQSEPEFVGAYGMTRELASLMETGSWYATGGTLFGSALQMAACRATLEEVLVDGA